MNIDLTPLLQAVIALLAAIITAKLIPWIKAHTNQQQQILMKATVDILVSAAEQLFGAGKGPEKLAYVSRTREARLHRRCGRHRGGCPGLYAHESD
jgi:hypothetical protein